MREAEFFTNTLNLSETEILESVIKVYPNPARETLHIKLSLENPSQVNVHLYSLSGVRIKTSNQNGFFSPGEHLINLNVNELASGTYIVALDINDTSITKLLVVD